MRAFAIVRATLVAAATGALMFTGTAAMAAAAGPVTTVVHEHQGTDTFVDVGPECGSTELFEITVTYNSVEKQTLFADGREHDTFTQTGTFEAVSLETGRTATGHFTVWGGFNANGKSVNGTFTFKINGAYDDGQRISVHSVDHFSAIPTGAVFEWSKCHG